MSITDDKGWGEVELKARRHEQTPEYCELVNALREFEQAHARWMSLSVFTPEGQAAKQYKNSCMCRYDQARKKWEESKRHDDRRPH